MKPLLFLVADKDMEHALKGFFGRDGWWRSAGCSPFPIDPRRDIAVAAGQHDPGLYTRAHELLAPFGGRYERAVVMLDAAWDGSPGAPAIREQVDAHLAAAGWPEERRLALVIDPEVDAWLWSDSPHAARALGWPDARALRRALEDHGWVAGDEPKPARPKVAAEWALRRARMPWSSAMFERVAAQVSVRRCRDPALGELLAALRAWFPSPGEH